MATSQPSAASDSAKTKLSRIYTFWLTINAAESQNFEDAIKKIGTFDTVEDFWAIYQHLKRPDDLPAKTDYNLVCFFLIWWRHQWPERTAARAQIE